jgi:hypothetical protein
MIPKPKCSARHCQAVRRVWLLHMAYSVQAVASLLVGQDPYTASWEPDRSLKLQQPFLEKWQ